MDLKQESKIRTAFQEGSLRVKAVSPSGAVEWKRVSDVHKAFVRPERIFEVATVYGVSTVTGGHRVYVSFTEVVDAESQARGLCRDGHSARASFTVAGLVGEAGGRSIVHVRFDCRRPPQPNIRKI